MSEIWKDITGFEGLYKCSSTGFVKRVISNRCLKERILKGSVHRGYLMVTLSKNDVHTRMMVHRIIGCAFIDNPDAKPFINHKDANPKNNSASNIEWCTQKENVQHCIKLGNRSGDNHWNTILPVEKQKEISKRFIPRKVKASDLALEYGVSTGYVRRMIRKHMTKKLNN